LPNEDLGADLWDVTQDACEKAGLPAYEVSNHAKIGQESRHNLIYWRSGNWAGIGPGAHGRLTLDGVRRETVCVKSPGMWIAQVESGALDLDMGSALGTSDILEERVLMGLRMVEGIEMSADWMTDKMNKINELSVIGHLEMAKNRLTVSAQGRPVLNAVISHLLTD
jgi:oxygen-independent coproporphyrinogen-3 oxidase